MAYSAVHVVIQKNLVAYHVAICIEYSQNLQLNMDHSYLNKFNYHSFGWLKYERKILVEYLKFIIKSL